MYVHAKWYNTQRWKRRRKLQLTQYPLCARCLRDEGIPVPATIADHVEPVRGDERRMWFGALQSLCDRCHSSIKAMEEGRAKPRPRIGLDGWPIPDTDPAR
jgi:hypothetical protein